MIEKEIVSMIRRKMLVLSAAILLLMTVFLPLQASMEPLFQSVRTERIPQPYDNVTFGSYPQDSYGNKKPIEWIVLSVSDDGKTGLLISNYILDSQRWHDSDVRVSWHSSYIRNWLNGTFYNAAFTASEKEALEEVFVSNSWDRVFLLNVEQANRYFAENGKVPGAEATDYALSLPARLWIDYEAKGRDSHKGVSSWWLRTDQSQYDKSWDRYLWANCADAVTTRSGVRHLGITNYGDLGGGDRDGVGVRPVIVVTWTKFFEAGGKY